MYCTGTHAGTVVKKNHLQHRLKALRIHLNCAQREALVGGGEGLEMNLARSHSPPTVKLTQDPFNLLKIDLHFRTCTIGLNCD